MIKKILISISLLVSLLFLVYLLMPNPEFPNPPADALQSKEPADTEDPLRRAYFTNYTRSEVIEWYQKEFKYGYLLNYPPEESQSIIRDQTRSTFLQEIVHPFRESLYINGFEPTAAKDAIFIEGKSWRQKIIIRYVPSLGLVRVLIFFGIIYATYKLTTTWYGTFSEYIITLRHKNKL